MAIDRLAQKRNFSFIFISFDQSSNLPSIVSLSHRFSSYSYIAKVAKIFSHSAFGGSNFRVFSCHMTFSSIKYKLNYIAESSCIGQKRDMWLSLMIEISREEASLCVRRYMRKVCGKNKIESKIRCTHEDAVQFPHETSVHFSFRRNHI